MKRTLLLSLLSLTASAITACGQSTVTFDNYAGNPVQWTADIFGAPPGRVGSLITAADTFKVDLQWQFGPMTGDAFLAVPVGDEGVFHGPAVILPAYNSSSGPITFTVLAWNGADYASSSATGTVTWSELNPGTSPVPFNMPTLIVQFVPEPSVFVLAGLGAAGIMLVRRRI